MLRGKLAKPVAFSIVGTLQVSGENGENLKPKSRKSQGLLALLITEKSLLRSRVWLQDKLWSDRAPEQGAGSLRQSLSELRRTFSDYPELLCSNRTDVWLNPEMVSIHENFDDDGLGREHFEGLDVKDPEFDHWLTLFRNSRGGIQSNPKTGPLTRSERTKPRNLRQVIFHLQGDGLGDFGFTEEVICEAVGRNLREQGDFDIHMRPPTVTHQDGLLVELQCFAPGSGGYGVRASIMSVATGQVIWSDMQPICKLPTFEGTPPDLLEVSSRISNQLIRAFLAERAGNDANCDANSLALMAMQKIFLLRSEEAQKGASLLESAFEISPRGVYQAWLAQLNTIEYIEGFRPKDEAASDAESRISYALELEGENSQVLTVAANCSLVFDRDPEFAGHLARSAVRSNPANAMAWWILGHVQLYAGKYEESYASTSRGQKLARGTFLQYWLDFQAAFASAYCGRLAEARINGQAASVLRPEFRAAHRFALAMNAATGDHDRARSAARKLGKLEVGFTPSRMVVDKEYPVNLVRSAPFFCGKSLLNLET